MWIEGVGVDHVAVVVLAGGELDPFCLAGELGVVRRGVREHPGAELVADLGHFGRGEEHRLGERDLSFAGLLSVVVEGDRAALGEAAAVVGEFGTGLVLSGRDGAFGAGQEHVDANKPRDNDFLAFLILVESPISGTSLNPARSTGSAVIAGGWYNLALYFIAPLLGAQLAILAFRRGNNARLVACAKLHHPPAGHPGADRCLMKGCAYRAAPTDGP